MAPEQLQKGAQAAGELAKQLLYNVYACAVALLFT